MTDDELWIRVGRILAEARQATGFSPDQLSRQIPHAPAKATIMTIEEGRPGYVSSLHDYAHALGRTLGGVLLQAFTESDDATRLNLPEESREILALWADLPADAQEAMRLYARQIRQARREGETPPPHRGA